MNTLDSSQEISTEIETLQNTIERVGFLKSFHKDRLKTYLRNLTYEERTYKFIHIKDILSSLKIPFQEHTYQSETSYIVDVSSLISISDKKLINIHDSLTILNIEITTIIDEMHESPFEIDNLHEYILTKIKSFTVINNV